MSIEATEADMIATLTAAAAQRVRKVESLPSEWDDDMLKRMLQMVPCILVAFAGGGAKAQGEVAAVIDSQWIVYAATGHASGQAARRLGDAQQVGAYELVQRVIIPALHQHTVPGVGTLSLVRIDNLFTGSVEKQGLAVYSVAFAMPLAFDVGCDPATLTPFETFDAQYDLPPLGDAAQHRQWLDGDYSASRPDARDAVALTQPAP